MTLKGRRGRRRNGRKQEKPFLHLPQGKSNLLYGEGKETIGIEKIVSKYDGMTFAHVLYFFRDDLKCDNCRRNLRRVDHYMEVKEKYAEFFEIDEPKRICGYCANTHVKKRVKVYISLEEE